MRLREGLPCLALAMAGIGAPALAAPIPPGRQHRVTIEGENTVTFLPQSGLPPVKVDYKAKVEYIVDTRLAKDPGLSAEEKPEAAEGPRSAVAPAPSKKAVAGKGGASAARARAPKGAEPPASRATGAVDLSLHSSVVAFRQDGRAILETKVSRARFQGRLQPDSPVMGVGVKEAPPRLQEVMKGFDVVAASLLVDDSLKVVGRKFRADGPNRAVVETILSIHAPIPRDADSWESPTQLAMGHGQTARGMLRFEKIKPAGAGAGAPSSADLVRVKVAGILKAEGVIAGNFIKDGTYTVRGEQTYDMHTREWVSSRWSVDVANELANQLGMTVAQAKGTMTVESRAVDATASTGEGAAPKL